MRIEIRSLEVNGGGGGGSPPAHKDCYRCEYLGSGGGGGGGGGLLDRDTLRDDELAYN